MILKETFSEVIKSQKGNLLKSDPGISRSKLSEINLSQNYASIISGIRRSGKSTLLRQLIEKLGDFNYFNFEDVRIFGFDIKDFRRLDLAFSSESSSNVFLFDEVQNVEGWERYVRTLLDRKNTLIITGSNATLLSKELGTKLTGRHLRYELFPFSYEEYLNFKKLKPSVKSFDEYFNTGGFPEYVKNGNDIILQELFNDIIARDIIVRYNLRNPKIVRELALYLLSNVGKEFSYQSLKKMYELGSVNTVISLISYYEDSYLLFTIPQFNYSYRKRLIRPKKVYAIDSGMIKTNSVSFSADKGRILENIVFIQLKRKGKEIFYYKDKGECDFVFRSVGEKMSASQVCYEITEENKEREVNGLIETLNFLNLKKGMILTHNQEDEIEVKGKIVSVTPVWKWLL